MCTSTVVVGVQLVAGCGASVDVDVAAAAEVGEVRHRCQPKMSWMRSLTPTMLRFDFCYSSDNNAVNLFGI